MTASVAPELLGHVTSLFEDAFGPVGAKALYIHAPGRSEIAGNHTDHEGGHVIAAALGGTAKPEAFLLKIVFTAITLGCGFKGGEIVPTLFVGSTFGCAAGALLGLPAGFAAALGITGLFCGMTNCPITSLLISVELFSADGLLCYAVVCAVSYVCSGYRGLYSSQTILYSKLRAEFINVHTK